MKARGSGIQGLRGFVEAAVLSLKALREVFGFGLGGRGLIYLPIFFQLSLPIFDPATYRRVRRWMGGVFQDFYSVVGMEKVEKIVDLQYLIKIHKFQERLLVGHGQIVR
jgi:hypothetical protein